MNDHQTILDNLIARDLRHIWHPGARMKDFESYPPLIIHQAKGAVLETDKGPLIDATSSWWCKSLGHAHPRILKAIKQQADSFEHVIAANTTHPALVSLGEKLALLTQKQHVFFASDGASAVEIALKLALHAQQLQGQSMRRHFIALKKGYHGETLGTLAVSDISLYKKPYEGFGPSCHFVDPKAWVKTIHDPLWQDASTEWDQVEKELESLKDQTCAVIIEPIVQGAAGMRCYSADFLSRLSSWTKKNNIYLIADEIMTGMCRTGQWLACDHAKISPDLLCLSKGLTSGSLPLSVVMVDHAIYELFYGNNEATDFLHSHTYSGNALAVSAALATIEVMEEEDICGQTQKLSKLLFQYMTEIATLSGRLDNVRCIGGVVAADMKPSDNPRIGYTLYQKALTYGALLRPINSTLYWLPPLNIDHETIANLAEITLNSIKGTYF